MCIADTEWLDTSQRGIHCWPRIGQRDVFSVLSQFPRRQVRSSSATHAGEHLKPGCSTCFDDTRSSACRQVGWFFIGIGLSLCLNAMRPVSVVMRVFVDKPHHCLFQTSQFVLQQRNTGVHLHASVFDTVSIES